MANNSNPPRPKGPPRPAGGGRKKSTRPSGRPRPSKGGASWKPGGGGSAAEPPVKPPSQPPPKPPKPAPDAPNAKDDHLQMVPLNGKSDDTYDDGKRPDSSTQFFAIPHANRQKSEPPRARPAAPPPAAGGGMPPGGPAPAAGPQPVGPAPVVGIQGPVAAGPMAAGPQAGGAAGFVPPNPDENRTTSYRVFGVVLGLAGMVCAALVVTVGLVVFAVIANQEEEKLPEIVDQQVKRPIAPIGDVDTGGAGIANAPIKPAPVTRPKPRPRPRPSNPKPAPKAAPEPSNATAAGEPGQVSVTIPSEIHVTQVELNCTGTNYRKRAPVSGNKAVFDGVPAGDCTMTFKGGTVATKVTVQAPKSLNCRALGTSALACQ